ncbi:alpha-amylase [Vibrio sinensis]|uniref:Alpha-amylase n=1 Tax=Vibrio sinensis TaxID=2302434 RepID=A0A3A6QZE1_9VIBR|nr:alpha-amylase family protein [Vibrio sinensis]RJX68931.1 alpha-amylase [Vibrio sinensis]
MLTAQSTDVILHAFDWPYTLVAQRAEAIDRAGYKSVLVSSPMKSKKCPQGTCWWQRYQPQDYRVIDNQLGDTHDFVAMISTLKERGIRLYIDVVFNHMENEADARSNLQYPSDEDLQRYQQQHDYYQSIRLFGDLSQPLFTHLDFVAAFPIEDWRDKWQVQFGRLTGSPVDIGLPTLAANTNVIGQQKEYLLAMKQLGVTGFRIDAAKHMTIEHLQQVWTKDICENVHIFGEIITDGGASKPEYELFLQPFLAKTQLGAYDFPLFKTLYDALQTQGSFTALIDPYHYGLALSESRALTFSITHDIPNNRVFSDLVMDEESEWLANTFILGRDGGVPLIYTDLDTSGILSTEGEPRWKDTWRDSRMVSRVMFHNLMHGKAMKVKEANDDLLVFSRGDDGWVAMNKSVRSQSVEITTNDTWHDLLSGITYQPDLGRISLKILAKDSAMLIRYSS